MKAPKNADGTECIENPEERPIITYTRGRFLGKGGFAKAYEVKRISPIETEEHRTKTWALKVVSKANLQRSKARQKLTSEIKIHRSLDHENVVRFDRYFEDKENVYILLDICHNQSLSDLVRRRKRLHEVEARYYIHQLVLGMEYVHQKGVIHRDLKLGNLFLTERLGLKIGDFGLAAQVFYEGERKKTVCGTPNYLAPEVLEGNNGHSYEVDYWSIGVILYTMLCGRPPFESPEVKQTYQKIKQGVFSFPDHLDIKSTTKQFIRQCLILDPSRRMNLQEMLAHDFFTSVPLPTQIPVSTLVCPPAEAFCKQFALVEQRDHSQSSGKIFFSPTKSAKKNKLGQTQPLDNALKQLRSQRSLRELTSAKKDVSPMLDSQQENGIIITPNGPATPTPQRLTNNYTGNIVSEFNLSSNKKRAEFGNNFIQTQNVVGLATIAESKASPRAACSPKALITRKSTKTLSSTLKTPNRYLRETTNTQKSSAKLATIEKGQDPAGQDLAKIQTTVAEELPVADLIRSCPTQPSTELVTKFVDFSSKYGLGYKLSTGDFGVLFNDSTKIVTVSPDLFWFCYIERVKSDANSQATETMNYYNFYDYPATINKKVVLLQHFKSYLEGNSKFKALSFDYPRDQIPPRPAHCQEGVLPPYIKKWKRAKKAILLRNSNKVIQVIFQDQSELVLASGSGIVTFVNARREVESCPLHSEMDLQLTN